MRSGFKSIKRLVKDKARARGAEWGWAGMPDARREAEEAVAALACDPGLARLVGPEAACMVFDGTGERLLWASPAAARIAAAITRDDPAGHVDGSLPLARRLRMLAAGLAPRDAVRLERLRLRADRLDSPVTCACRRLSFASGEETLLVAIADHIPAAQRVSVAAPVVEEDRLGPQDTPGARPRPGIQPGRAAAPASAVSPRRPGTVRFLWHADAEGRFTFVSNAFAEVVGASAEVVGRRWDEIVGDVVEDPGAAVAEAFAQGRTWTGLVVEWRVAGSGRSVPIDLAGMPVRARDGRLIGFRGFGLYRGDELAGQPQPLPPAAEPEQAEAPAVESETRPPEHPAHTAPGLSFLERSAFREIARALGARLQEDEPEEKDRRPEEISGRERDVTPFRPAPPAAPEVARILDRLPVGVLIHRGDEPLFANRLLLDLIDYDDIGQLAAEGGMARLFRGRPGPLARFEEAAPLALATRRDGSVAVDVRLTTVEWGGLPASLMLVRRAAEAEQAQRLRALELDLRARDARLRELSSILDTATDGVVVLDDEGRILSLNRSAEALFGYDENEVVGERFIVLLAPESHGVALGYMDGLRVEGVASLLNDGREVSGRVRQGGTIPLFMTVGRISEAPERKFCAVLRDITSFKKTEGELLSAKRAAEEGSAQKSDFLAAVSHEIRTPLNAIIGFAEVMLEERFGPIGNERYKDYLRDIHASGGHVISLVNDLLDLAKVEAGRMELAFASVRLNDIVAAAVALMQPEAARQRIVMRTSFAPKLPAVVADERSMRQIALNLISNAIRFTEAGGQVIVSTAATDRGEVAIRVRDTGLGMSPEDVAAALEPFRQLATARRGGGTGLGLPLTKALVEANRGALRITSARNEGTLVEVLFPPTRVLAD